MEPSEFKTWLTSYTDAEKCLEAFYNQKQFFRINTIKMRVDRFLRTTKIKCRQTQYYDAAFELLEENSYRIEPFLFGEHVLAKVFAPFDDLLFAKTTRSGFE